MRKRLSAVLAVAVVVSGCGPQLTPMERDDSLPTFDPTGAPRPTYADTGEGAEARAALRQAVLDAAGRQRASRCDADLRKAYLTALRAYVKAKLTDIRSDPASETAWWSTREDLAIGELIDRQVQDGFVSAKEQREAIVGATLRGRLLLMTASEAEEGEAGVDVCAGGGASGGSGGGLVQPSVALHNIQTAVRRAGDICDPSQRSALKAATSQYLRDRARALDAAARSGSPSARAAAEKAWSARGHGEAEALAMMLAQGLEPGECRG